MAISRVLVALCLAFCISLSLALLEAERPYYDLYKDNRALEGLQTTELNGDVLLDPKSSLWNMQIQVRTLAKGTGERKKLHVGYKLSVTCHSPSPCPRPPFLSWIFFTLIFI